ncbi:MAG: RHS repeat protein, partial [candidate division Zixibacteria bacterium]|nr:RHS repeat protein [candidate division Zixibacteria bacterium]
MELEYDEAGNTTVNYDRYQFFYDYENRLIEVQTDANDVVVQYTYNALGRRSQKHEILGLDDDYIRYYYNKDYQVLTETDEDDAELRSFVYGRGLDEVLLMMDPNGTDYYYLKDHLNSVVAVVDEDGDILERYEYDAYGKPTMWLGDYDTLNQEISPYGNPYYFTGRRIDFVGHSAWMIQYNRNRFYDYYTGRWLTQDMLGLNATNSAKCSPISQYDDTANLYEYVRSNPLLHLDSFGFQMYVDPRYKDYYGKCGPDVTDVLVKHLNDFISQEDEGELSGIWFFGALELQGVARKNGPTIREEADKIEGCPVGEQCKGTYTICHNCFSGYHIDHFLIMVYIAESYGNKKARSAGQWNESILKGFFVEGSEFSGSW